jgi:hypothetical protein
MVISRLAAKPLYIVKAFLRYLESDHIDVISSNAGIIIKYPAIVKSSESP